MNDPIGELKLEKLFGLISGSHFVLFQTTKTKYFGFFAAPAGSSAGPSARSSAGSFFIAMAAMAHGHSSYCLVPPEWETLLPEQHICGFVIFIVLTELYRRRLADNTLP